MVMFCVIAAYDQVTIPVPSLPCCSRQEYFMSLRTGDMHIVITTCLIMIIQINIVITFVLRSHKTLGGRGPLGAQVVTVNGATASPSPRH